MRWVCKILLLLSALGGINKAFGWTDMEVIRVGRLGNNTEIINYHLRVKKINRSTCAIAGTIECLIDSKQAENYRVEMRVFHSANGNNQFKLFPMKVDSCTISKFCNGFYRTYLMNDLKPPISNIPYSDENSVDLAELITKPANYTINDFFLSLNKIPKMIPNGLYKLLFELTSVSGDILSGFEVLATVY